MSTLALTYFLVLKPRQHLASLRSTRAVLPQRSLLTRLVRRAAETNLLSLAVHLAVEVLYLEGGRVYYWYSAPAFVVVKVYGISLLATLNARRPEEASVGHPSSGPRSQYGFSASRFAASTQARSGGVTFELETQVRVDKSDSAVHLPVDAVRPPVYVPAFGQAGSAASDGAKEAPGHEAAGEEHEPDQQEGDKAEAKVNWV